MDWFATIKRYYDLGCYTEAQVNRFVVLKKITQVQADEIVGVVASS
ncbi:phage uncharacterized protein, XkdX family [Paenibacillaceae bacterium GAS479]|nr:phage uncharacterized protein, XkdX family [Paenibacillaceae bacterium GAS479]